MRDGIVIAIVLGLLAIATFLGRIVRPPREPRRRRPDTNE